MAKKKSKVPGLVLEASDPLAWRGVLAYGDLLKAARDPRAALVRSKALEMKAWSAPAPAESIVEAPVDEVPGEVADPDVPPAGFGS